MKTNKIPTQKRKKKKLKNHNGLILIDPICVSSIAKKILKANSECK